MSRHRQEGDSKPSDPAARLAELLGEDGLAALDGLGEDDLRRFAELLEAARTEQRQAVIDAGERALEHVPRLLRGPVRKVVTG